MRDTVGEERTNPRDILLLTPTHRRSYFGRTDKNDLPQLVTDIGCSLEDLPEAVDDRERKERERKRESQENHMLAAPYHDDDELFLYDFLTSYKWKFFIGF